MLKIFSKNNTKKKKQEKRVKKINALSTSKKWKQKYKKRRRKLSIKNLFLFSKAFYRKCFRTKIFRYLSVILILGLLFWLVRYFILSPDFEIKSFEILGTKNLNSRKVEKLLEDYKRENIFLVRSSSIQNELYSYSTLVKSVKVDKVLPDKIIVEFEERTPYLLWIDLGGIYLFDKEGVMLEVKEDFQDLKLSEEDCELLKGYGNLERFEEAEEKQEEDSEGEKDEPNVKEDDQEKNMDDKEKEMSQEEKLEKLETQRQEVISRVNFFLDDQIEDKTELLEEYQVIYSYQINSFEKLEELNNEIFNFSDKIADIKFGEEEFTKYVWESEYRMVIYLTRGRKIIFSVKRDLSEQIESLKLLMADLKKEGKVFRTIDLSSEVIMYEVEQ